MEFRDTAQFLRFRNHHIFVVAAVLLLWIGASESHAQISLDFSLTPTVNWLEDVESTLLQLEEDPEGVDPDSLRLLFEEDFSARLGFEAGLGLTIEMGPVGLRGGLRVLNPGGVFDATGEWDQQQLLENFVIGSVDLQYRYRTGPAVFYVFGGPEFRYYLDLRGEDDITLAVVQNNMEPVSTSAAVGAGVTLQLLNMRITPEVRYAHGLSGVNKRSFEADGFRFEDEYQLNTFHFGLRFGR